MLFNIHTSLTKSQIEIIPTELSILSKYISVYDQTNVGLNKTKRKKSRKKNEFVYEERKCK